jgi:hypothetical protein
MEKGIKPEYQIRQAPADTIYLNSQLALLMIEARKISDWRLPFPLTSYHVALFLKEVLSENSLRAPLKICLKIKN